MTTQKPADDKPMTAREMVWDNVKTIAIALALAFVIKTVFVQPFHIPSGSMQPNLLSGDYVITTKWSYGYNRLSLAPFVMGPRGKFLGGAPKRGEVAVFRSQYNTRKDLIKRVVGLPGDRIQMRGGVLHINDVPVQLEPLGKQRLAGPGNTFSEIDAYRETFPDGHSHTVFNREDNGLFDDTAVFSVPEGHYFMMGDDRDNSSDSRADVGFVPDDHLVAKAQFVLVSFKQGTQIWMPWTLVTGFRLNRIVHAIS
jgi:signal peptidase I